MTDETKQPVELKFELSQFHGDDVRYRSINPKLLYTPGVKHLAEHAGAYWLIDAIASYVPSKKLQKAIRHDDRVPVLHFWQLWVLDNGSATLSARVDSGVAPFITQVIPWTDFPLSTIELWCGYDGKSWTLYLPSEH